MLKDMVLVGKKGKKERQTSRSGQTVDGTIRKRLLQAKGWTSAGWLFRGSPGLNPRWRVLEGASRPSRMRVRRLGFSSGTTFQHRLRPPLPAHGGVTSQPDAADAPSSPPSLPPPSPPPRRKLAATPEEALYLTANNRTIFHVTALARLATSTRRVCRPAFARRQKGIEDGERLSWHSSWITAARKAISLMAREWKKAYDKCPSVVGWYPYIGS